MDSSPKIMLIAKEGEGQTIEFKMKPSNLDREMVAFANAMGGSIFIGIDDNGNITGTSLSNKFLSQIQDIARNCDPPLHIAIKKHLNVLEVEVKEGMDKPYRCQGGFFLRNGPNSQKLTRDEIINFAIGEGKIRFDERINSRAVFDKDFSFQKYREYLRIAKLDITIEPGDILANLGAAELQKGKLLLTNAACLFFMDDPQKYYPEAYVTAIRYHGPDRVTIIDRKDMRGDLVSQVGESMNFFKRHTSESLMITGAPRHDEVAEYPASAIREAVINALMHRDYFYDSSRVYMHIFSDRIEIENPGGLFKGLTVEDLGRRSVRRNRLIAELFFRLGFIEMVGGGIGRMFAAMKDNGNPPPEIRATNFFTITFKRRVLMNAGIEVSERQRKLLHFVKSRGPVSRDDCARHMEVSGDTALRELKTLLKRSLVEQTGRGRATRYSAK